MYQTRFAPFDVDGEGEAFRPIPIGYEPSSSPYHVYYAGYTRVAIYVSVLMDSNTHITSVTAIMPDGQTVSLEPFNNRKQEGDHDREGWYIWDDAPVARISGRVKLYGTDSNGYSFSDVRLDPEKEARGDPDYLKLEVTQGYFSAPTVTEVSATPVSIGHSFNDIYIAGYSKVQVSATIKKVDRLIIPENGVTVILPGGRTASLHFVSRSVISSGWVNEIWEGESPIVTVSGDLTVSVKEQNGFGSVSQPVALTVAPYTKPTISLNTLYRCEADGTANSGGAYFKVAAVANIKGAPDIPQNRVEKLTAGISGGTQVDISDGAPHIIGGLTNPNSKYTIAVITQDAVSGEVQRTKILLGELHDMVLARGSNDSSAHLGVGKIPEKTGENSSIQLPIGGEFKIDAANILYLMQARPYLGNSSLKVGDQYNLLAINATNRFARVNEAMTIQLYMPDDVSQWLHLPKEVSEYTGQSRYFTVTRFVIFAASNVVYVVLLERDPELGRIWFQYGNLSTPGTTYWRSKWRYFSLTEES